MLEGNNSNGTLAAFLTGAIVGGAIALLYSPRSGKETREMLTDRAQDIKNRADAAIDQARTAIHDTKDQVVAAVDAGIHAIHAERKERAG